MDESIELRKEIISLLKENSGEMEEEKICALLGIDSYEVPWGYNIGWARCLQSNQNIISYYLSMEQMKTLAIWVLCNDGIKRARKSSEDCHSV